MPWDDGCGCPSNDEGGREDTRKRKMDGGEWSCIRRKTEKQGTKEGRAKADRSMDPRGEVG